MSAIEVSKKLVIINSMSSAVTLVLNLSVLVWLQQYLLKRISPEEYSLIPILMSLMAFSPLLTTFLTSGLGRYITVAYAKGDNEEVTRICSTMFPVLLVAGAMLLSIGWLAAWHVDNLVEVSPQLMSDAQLMLGLLVIPAAARLPLAVFGSGFLIRQKLMLHDMIDVACQLLRIVMLLALIMGVSPRVLWVTVATVTSELAYLTIATVISMRLVPAQKVKWGIFHKRLASEIASFGGWSFVGQIAETIKQTVDPLMLNRFASAVDVSVFYVAGIAPRQLRLMVLPITRPLFPVLAAIHAAGDFVRLSNVYLRTARYHTWVLLCVGIPAMVFSNEVIHLYLGGKYDQAGPVMAVLVAVAVLGGLNALGPALVAVVGAQKGYALRIVPVYVANLALTALLVAYLQMGADGSAIATLITVAAGEVAFVGTYCRRLAHTSTRIWVREVVLPTFAPAIPPLVLCLAVKGAVGLDTWTGVMTTSALSALLYLGLVMTFSLRQQDRLDIGKVAERLPGPLKTIASHVGRR